MKPRLSNKSAVQSFFKQAVPVKSPAPKFSVGDYIINTKYKVISKIVGMRGDFENEDRTVNYDMCEYIMVDIKNDARDNYIASSGVPMNETTKALTVERKYKRYKPVRAIDAYYTKINPGAAQSLYGIKVTSGDESES